MHVLQYIATKAEDEDMAMRVVNDFLESEMGGNDYAYNSWYDWFVIGGGRFVDGDPYASSPNHIISYKDKPVEFVSMIDRMISNRIVEFKGYRKNFESKNIDLSAKLDTFDGTMQYDFDLYDLSKLIDMIQGKWDYNSYFFDQENSSTNPKWVLDNLSDSWYIVPVDFHF